VPQEVVEHHEEVTPQEVGQSELPQITQELRRSVRARHSPKRYKFLVTQYDDAQLISDDELTTYNDAIRDPDSAKWLKP
jgi:hypothetical protein